MGEGEDALGRQPAPVLVHGGEGRDHLVHEPDLVVAHVARGFVVGDAVQQLPQEGRPVVGVARQQLVEEGRARPCQAGHDDRALHGLRQHCGLPLPQVHHAQAVLEDQLELGAHAEAPRQVQQGLGPQRRAQALERLLPPGVAEIVEPGGRASGRAQVVGVERDQRRPVVAEALAERDHLLRPRAARRWDPGHEAATVSAGGKNGRVECATR